MNKKRKIIAWIIVCSIWNVLVITMHIIMRSSLEFPTLNFERGGWLIPIFMTVPFHALFFGIISVYRKRLMKVFAVIYTAVGMLCYLVFISIVLYINFAFEAREPLLYPLISETDNPAHYLVFDNETEYEKICEALPMEIPEAAQNVTYKYRYIPEGMDYTVDAQWALPGNDFEKEKERVSTNAQECIEEDNKTVCTFFWCGQYDRSPGALYNIEIEFDNETGTVSYHLLKNVVTS